MIAITATIRHPALFGSRLVCVWIGVIMNDGPSCGPGGPMIAVTRMMATMEMATISMTVLLVISRMIR